MENLEPDWFDEDRIVGESNGPNETNLSAIPLRDTDEFMVPWVFLGYSGTHRVRVLSCGLEMSAFSKNFLFFGGLVSVQVGCLIFGCVAQY